MLTDLKFLDAGLRDCVVITKNVFIYPQLAEVSRCEIGTEVDKDSKSLISIKNYHDTKTSTPLIPRQQGTQRTHRDSDANYNIVSFAGRTVFIV